MRSFARGLACLWLLSASVWAQAAGTHVDVQVEGVQGPLLDNVMNYLSINTYRDSPTLTDTLVERLHARAPGEIRQALEPFGYYDVQVKSELTPLAGGWRAQYSITLPPQVRIRHIDVTLSGDGRNDGIFGEYMLAMPIHPGDPLNQPMYESVKRRLQEIAAHHGYINAQFTVSRLEVNPEAHWADITLSFDTGMRYFFGPVTFVQDFMDPAFLNRYVRFQPGDPYDADRLLALQYALDDTEYFGSVTVEVLRDQAVDRRIPIRITLSPRKRNKYTIGFGYGTDTGPRVTLGWENRRLNGLGHSFAAQAQFSHVLESAQVNYTVPLSDPASERLVYSLGNTRQVLGDAISYTSIFGINRYTFLEDWSENQYVQLEHDRSNVSGTSTNSTLLMPGVTFSRTYGDDPLVPTHGYRASLDLRGANNALGSDTSFLQTHLQAKLILSLNETSRILLRAEVGATAVKSFDELPVSQRFFAGGDQSVRGFAYNSLGPQNDQGQVVGGQDIMVGSVEVDHRFGPIFGVAAFFDAGNAFNTFTNSLEKGVGAGLRWRTPVGMVRLDLAHPIKRPDLDQVRIHISIGPDL